MFHRSYFDYLRQANALVEKFKDISNRVVLPKADVGRLFVGRGEAGAGS